MKNFIKVLSIFVICILLFQCFSFANKTVADTAVNLKKGKALILVNYDKEKVLYDGLVLREQNFDFQIDIVSLQERKISKSSPKKIKEFLFENKNDYNYFVLDENIAYGIINDELYSDYFYAFTNDLFEYDKETAVYFGGTVERYPDLILSRIKRDQIRFYSSGKNRLESLTGMFGLPIVFFNRHQPTCGVGNYQIDLSYSAYFLKKKLEEINSAIKITTLCDDRSSDLLPKDKIKIKPRKKPDFSLTKENFEELEAKNNFFMLFNTAEPLGEEDIPRSWGSAFTSALWQDKNRDGEAEKKEIEVLQIKAFDEMNTFNIFSFYFVPAPNRIKNIPAPFVICQPFDFGEGPPPSVFGTLNFFVDEDHEGSSASTFWNGILTNVSKGMTFAEATLLGYTSYFKILKETEDSYYQALNAARLTFFGLPWYTIKDLTKQPEIKLGKTKYQTIGNQISIPIQNIGDKDLIVKVKENKETEYVSSIVVQLEETKNLVVKKRASQMFNLGTYRLPRKSNVVVNLMTNDTKHPNIQLKIEFWE